MAVIGGSVQTMLDIAASLGPDTEQARMINVLEATNEMYQDMAVIEANKIDSHQHTRVAALPDPTIRDYNEGVEATKGVLEPVTDSSIMMESYVEVDKSLAERSGNVKEYRMKQALMHMEGMNQAMMREILYGTGKLQGLLTRSVPGHGFDDYLLDAAGVGATNTSILLVSWHEMTCFGFYPRGSKAGLSHTDLGEDTAENWLGTGKRLQILRAHLKHDLGLGVADPRYKVAIRNIDVSALTKDAQSGADLMDLMVQATEIMPNLNMGRTAFYCNRTLRSFLRRQIINKSNNNLTFDTVAGKRVLAFAEVPVRRLDAILNTEEAISFA